MLVGGCRPDRRRDRRHAAQPPRRGERSALGGGDATGGRALGRRARRQRRLQPGAPPGSAILGRPGRTTRAGLGAVLGRCAVFAGGDSGVMHVAAAAGTPVVAIFGPTNADAWGPWYGGDLTPRPSSLRGKGVPWS